MTTDVRTAALKPDGDRTRGRLRGDLIAVGAAAALLAAAVIVGAYLKANGYGKHLWTSAAPLFGNWLPHIGPGSVVAVLLAIAVVAWGPALAARLAWRTALSLSYVAAVGWTFSLALVDGWERGFATRLTTRTEYLTEVPGVTDIGAMIGEFTGRIPITSPGEWAAHVGGHPPGALLVFVWLDRIGLGGGAAASTVCVLVGCLIAVTVPVAVRVLAGETAARAVLPFAVLFPGAVWIGASADGLFAGVASVGLALLVLACTVARTTHRIGLALAAGLVLGFSIFLSYGLVLMGPLAIGVVLYRRAWGVLAAALAGALVVTAVFTLAGFWWLNGYHVVLERYYQDVGAARWYSYWVWANLAAFTLAIGPAVVAGLRQCGYSAVRRYAEPALVLVAGALAAILIADISGLSKAETERIWLPFAVWLLPAVALLPRSHYRGWLAAQAVTALAVNHLVLTAW